MNIDIAAYLIVIVDLFVAGFLIWRATSKTAILWGSARAIYLYIATLAIYHLVIYVIALFSPASTEQSIVYTYLHPIVVLYTLNPVLIAIIHYRGGHLWK